MATLPNNSDLTRFSEGFEIIAARSTTESEPTYICNTGKANTVRTYLKYSGTVSSIALKLWFYVDGVWYGGPTTGDGDALSGSSAGNEARDWEVEEHTTVGFTVSTIAGGGTVAVRAKGID